MSEILPQIVITGSGLITALGATRETAWKAVCAGRCGVGPMAAMEQPLPAGKDGGQALELEADSAEVEKLPREARYLRKAIRDALQEAAIDINASPCSPDRSAVMIGTTLHGMRAGGAFLRSGNFDHLHHFLAGDTLNLAAADLPFNGLSATTCSACSSSLGSIALAVTLLQSRQYDLIIAGGYDTISEYVYGGFNSLRLVAEGPLKPFSRNRQGMKLAEGYGIVILERAADAAKRNAKPLAQIAGWGESADAHHLTQPHPKGEGAARAIRSAIERAGLGARDIDLIAAHATGTPDNDAAEYAALAETFAGRLRQIPVVGFKSHLGHTLGGAGAVELILSMMALRDQTVPPCANIAADEIAFTDLHVAQGSAKRASINATLNTSLGFGGANTSIVLTAPHVSSHPAGATKLREVFITGVGVIYPGVLGNQAFLDHLFKPSVPAWEQNWPAIPDSDLEGLLNARRVRRMSDYVKLQLAAATLAIRDAGIADVTGFAATCSSILGTMHGSAGYSLNYYEQIVREGILAANPMLFAEGVPNGGAAQLSLMLGIKGACQTIIGTRTAGLDALNLAAARIATGAWDRAIVGAGEEKCDIIEKAYQHCGLASKGAGRAPFTSESGFVYGGGSVAIILESRESIAARQGIAKAKVTGWNGMKTNPAALPKALAKMVNRFGPVDAILASANATWIDRAELMAIRAAEHHGEVSSIYGHAPELFSAAPLLGIAAVLLSGRAPKVLGNQFSEMPFAAATGDASAKSFTTIASDFTGAAAATRIEIL